MYSISTDHRSSFILILEFNIKRYEIFPSLISVPSSSQTKGTEARIAILVLTLSQRVITLESPTAAVAIVAISIYRIPRSSLFHAIYTRNRITEENEYTRSSSTVYSARGCEHSSFRNRNPSKACQPATFAETDGAAAREKRARMREGDARRRREELPIELEELGILVEHERQNDRDPSATVSPAR